MSAASSGWTVASVGAGAGAVVDELRGRSTAADVDASRAANRSSSTRVLAFCRWSAL